MSLTPLLSTSRILLFLLVGLLTVGSMSSCNSEKRLAKKELEAKTEMAKVRLQAILDDDGSMTVEQMDTELNEIKSWNLTDEVVLGLTTQVEKKIADAKERIREKKIEEAKITLLEMINNDALSVNDLQNGHDQIAAMDFKDEEVDTLLEQLATKIANMERIINATNDLQKDLDFIARLGKSDVTAANAKIEEVLSLFDNLEVPVLIIVAREGDIVDYDRPTTIQTFLEYLKDKNVNNNRVEHIKRNSFGKIIELELIKK